MNWTVTVQEDRPALAGLAEQLQKDSLARSIKELQGFWATLIEDEFRYSTNRIELRLFKRRMHKQPSGIILESDDPDETITDPDAICRKLKE